MVSSKDVIFFLQGSLAYNIYMGMFQGFHLAVSYWHIGLSHQEYIQIKLLQQFFFHGIDISSHLRIDVIPVKQMHINIMGPSSSIYARSSCLSRFAGEHSFLGETVDEYIVRKYKIQPNDTIRYHNAHHITAFSYAFTPPRKIYSIYYNSTDNTVLIALRGVY